MENQSAIGADNISQFTWNPAIKLFHVNSHVPVTHHNFFHPGNVKQV